MNKRDLMLSFTDRPNSIPYTPAAFFLHFDNQYHRGQSAIDKHLEFFHYTGMDFVKIQYELSFPSQPEIKAPSDWVKLRLPPADFYQDQWDIVAGLVKAAGREALVLMTLYSPFMCAGQIVDRDLVLAHIYEDPDAFKKGIERITQSLRVFVQGCIQRGIDGFYHSTQGGETFRLGNSPLFDTYVKSYDLSLMQEINQATRFNILHICDYHGGYSDLTPFLDYPGDVINSSLELGDARISAKSVSKMFERPFMGGMDRKGILTSGNKEAIVTAVQSVIANAPAEFILAADCTVPGDTDWYNLKTAIDTAHNPRFSRR
jgi:uroporphyrinogen decarboxylase